MFNFQDTISPINSKGESMTLLAPADLQSHQSFHSPTLTLIPYSHRHNITNQKTFFQKDTLIYIKKGQKVIHSHTQTHTINAKEYLLLPKGSYTFSNIDLDEGYQSYLFFFENHTLSSLIDKYCQPLPAHKTPIFHPLFFDLEEFMETLFMQEELLKIPHFLDIKCQELFLLLYYKHKQTFGEFLSLIQSRKDTLLDILSSDDCLFDSVSDMADKLKIDLSVFSKRFKEETGISPKEWLDKIRFSQAKTMLTLQEKTISQIANDLNFSSSAWFIKRFKEQFGITPKQFQKQSKNQYFFS